MSLDIVQVGSIGVTITVTVTEGGVAKDISTATGLKMYLQCMGQEAKSFTPSFVGTGSDGKMKYITTAAADINTSGIWTAQIYYELGTFKGYTQPIEAFDARGNLP
jgi:hypothetical protein